MQPIDKAAMLIYASQWIPACAGMTVKNSAATDVWISLKLIFAYSKSTSGEYALNKRRQCIKCFAEQLFYIIRRKEVVDIRR